MMLIAPLMRNNAVTLPEADNSSEKPETQEQTVVVIDSGSRFYVNAIPARPADLVPRVQKALEDKREKLVYIKGDKDAKYSAIMTPWTRCVRRGYQPANSNKAGTGTVVAVVCGG